MTISFEGINTGDIVRIEFVVPLKGWVEGPVTGHEHGYISLESEDDFVLHTSEIQSISVVEPILQPGDAVLWDGKVWLVGNPPDRFMSFNSDGDIAAIQQCRIPPDAVWLKRSGKLNNNAALLTKWEQKKG